MFRLFHNKLSEYSHHYIDWSRVGELLFSNHHHYTRDQLITRGIIIGFTAASAFIGYYLNDEETTGCSNMTICLANGLLGFTLSHATVIYPLVKKRYEMNQECLRLKDEIQKLANTQNNSPFNHTINATVDAILKISLSDDQHSRASETWGRRKNLLLKFSYMLASEETDRSFLNQDAHSIVEYLNEHSNFRDNVHLSRI
ncbi:MAG: hypothetical protein KIT56_03450 [Gammaproteobacteria bacterium]|nr:hypothetical protein [Gammaproteobacteria bacterium]MCW5582933.1 hypothetical protein [Gammaproteobacteria bacterium]